MRLSLRGQGHLDEVGGEGLAVAVGHAKQAARHAAPLLQLLLVLQHLHPASLPPLDPLQTLPIFPRCTFRKIPSVANFVDIAPCTKHYCKDDVQSFQ